MSQSYVHVHVDYAVVVDLKKVLHGSHVRGVVSLHDDNLSTKKCINPLLTSVFKNVTSLESQITPHPA